MRSILRLVPFLLVLQFVSLTTAQEPSSLIESARPRYRATYREVATWYEYRRTLPRTNVEIQNDLVDILKSKIGQRGFERIFKGQLTLPIDTPGLERTVLNTALDNLKSGQGHRRTLMYAESIQRGNQFQVDGINTSFRIGEVSGDHDMQISSRTSGNKYNIEVKNVRKLRLNTHLKQQIEKEIRESIATNRKYIFASRFSAPTNVREFVESRGGIYLEDVSSNSLSDKLAKLDQPSPGQPKPDTPKLSGRLNLGAGGSLVVLGGVGGIYEMVVSGKGIFDGAHSLAYDPNVDQIKSSLNITENVLRFGAGGVGTAEAVAGGLLLAGYFTESVIVTTYIPGIGLVVAPVLLGGEAGILLARWRIGYLSDAEFSRSFARTGVRAGGFVAGAAIGAYVGTFVTPGVGTLVGAGIGGGIGYGVSSLGVGAYDYLSLTSASTGMLGTMSINERKEYFRFVRTKYSLN